MNNYEMGEDHDGNPLKENKFYTHITSERIIQLLGDTAGFREVENRENVNIFDLSNGPEYLPSTEDDLETHISLCDKRRRWLTKSLQQLTEEKQSDLAQQKHDAMDGEP